MTLILHHENELSLTHMRDVAMGDLEVGLAQETRRLLDSRRQEVVEYITATNQPAYGFNRGFGSNVHDSVRPEDLAALQANLIRSHCAGVGPAAPVEVVRATMCLRIQSLCRGHSAVRSQTVQQLVDFLNYGVTPVVPRLGSVSASGDLAPLSHIALALMGEGEVFFKGERMPAAQALQQCGLDGLELQMKEGLALNNGCQFSTAYGVLAALDMQRLVVTAALITALTAQVMLGADTPFRRDLHELRRHPGGLRAAEIIYKVLRDAPIRKLHDNYELDGEVQDPYNLRCAAQILGPCFDLVDRALATFVIEVNSVTDNPVLLPAADGNRFDGDWIDKYVDVVSGGHFHGMPVAVDAYGLLQAASIIATLSNRRCARYVDRSKNKGLGPQLKWPGPFPNAEHTEAHRATRSGMMIPEYTTAGLANWLWAQCMPSHLMSLSTDSGQEDHVSMAANVAMRAYEERRSLAYVLAVELSYVAQAMAIRKEMRRIPAVSGYPGVDSDGYFCADAQQFELSMVSEEMMARVSECFETVREDRVFTEDFEALADLLLSGDLVEIAKQNGVPC